jgi:hypothetical protein
MDAAPGCRFLAEALLSQHIVIDCVARAGSAGTKSTEVARALFGPAHHVGAPVVENRTVGRISYIGLDDEGKRSSELGNRGRLRHGQLSSPWRSGRRFANFQRQRGPADPPVSVFCADGPF